MEAGTQIAAESATNGKAAEPTKLELERYVESVTAAVERVRRVEQALDDLIDEGWPTKMRGDRQARLGAIAEQAREAEREAKAVSPSQSRLVEVHTNFIELTEAHTKIAATGAEADDLTRDPQRTDALLAAKDDARREVEEWIVPLGELAIAQGVDLSPIAKAVDAAKRSIGESLKRFALRLVRPFLPIVPLSARRLFVLPFHGPYGPLAPPSIVAYAGWVSRHIGWIPLLGFLAAAYLLIAGFALAAMYYMTLATWWIFFGWWISLIASARTKTAQ